MNKSLEFVQKRIESGMFEFDFREDTKWDTLNFIENIHAATGIEYFIDNKISYTLKGTSVKGNPIEVKISIEYDPNTDFQYITHESCRCDGTLLFAAEQVTKIWNKLCTLGTYNKNELPYDFEERNIGKYEVRCTVGDFVFADEFSKDFGTKEKPWMMSRFTTMLPIKNEFVRVGE